MSDAQAAAAAVIAEDHALRLPGVAVSDPPVALREPPATVVDLGARGALVAERRDTLRRRALALADVAAALVAFAAMTAVIGIDGLAYAPLAAVLPVWVVLNKLLGLYDRDAHVLHKSTLDELGQIAQSVAIGTAIVYFVAPSLVPSLELGRLPALLYWATATLAVAGARTGVRSVVGSLTTRERVLIVGAGPVGQLVAAKLRSQPEYGADVVGFLDNEESEDPDVLGGLDRFDWACRRFDVERVVIAFTAMAEHQPVLEIIRQSKQLGLKVTMVPRLYEVMGDALVVDKLQGMTVLGMRGLLRTRSSLMLKRSLDVCGALFGLVVLAPLMCAIAAAVKLGSPGPVFFRQKRIGRGDREFTMYKFRTMVDGAESMKVDLLHLNEADGPLFKIVDDPRVTRVGAFLRRTHLDELPQLWNVLRGEMSLVGPRPLVPDEDACLIGWHRRRLELTPGLTGPWQVLGRHELEFDEMVQVDYLYVADWSLWNDVKLLLRTIPLVLRRAGY